MFPYVTQSIKEECCFSLALAGPLGVGGGGGGGLGVSRATAYLRDEAVGMLSFSPKNTFGCVGL